MQLSDTGPATRVPQKRCVFTNPTLNPLTTVHARNKPAKSTCLKIEALFGKFLIGFVTSNRLEQVKVVTKSINTFSTDKRSGVKTLLKIMAFIKQRTRDENVKQNLGILNVCGQSLKQFFHVSLKFSVPKHNPLLCKLYLSLKSSRLISSNKEF